MSEEINFDDVVIGEPIKEREPDYRDGFIRGIYRAKNIIDSKQKEIERLNNIIEKLDNYVIADQMFEFGNTREEAEQYLQELKGSNGNEQ